ncbi:hypothetical protein [Bifidobacterium crudilactis]|jgi:hypothetical protein|uniref:Uncharacterized protein n=1 Tax=Bifidobacterium crudilactis TaxID=327277 RepID=A0A971CZQ3_9BIFI|nr:hypothetical protein [Bifidobacterium crudilactis]MCI1868075.1 hypothetical protein [Bifidobacterium crudilactis]MDN5971509.1 hypothetical protein [Bifidobacterium crudilactis]MDN6000859.1 hypothetical protein [Bifidobacterium crudilactis]MDN6208692.1 hypothetical protein [Bifidobacterium crudilactis]MDN6234552.1 hypothetical protein [Bifidobacterium crudilactis]
MNNSILQASSASEAHTPFISPSVRACECLHVSQECRVLVARAIADCASICEEVKTTLDAAQHVNWQGTASRRFRDNLSSTTEFVESLLSEAKALKAQTDAGAW